MGRPIQTPAGSLAIRQKRQGGIQNPFSSSIYALLMASIGVLASDQINASQQGLVVWLVLCWTVSTKDLCIGTKAPGGQRWRLTQASSFAAKDLCMIACLLSMLSAFDAPNLPFIAAAVIGCWFMVRFAKATAHFATGLAIGAPAIVALLILCIANPETPVSADFVVIMYTLLVAVGTVCAVSFSTYPDLSQSDRDHGVKQPGIKRVLYWIDLPIAPLVLAPESLVIYASARLIFLVPTAFVQSISRSVQERFKHIQNDNAHFSESAFLARASLGLLLVGASIHLMGISFFSVLATFGRIEFEVAICLYWMAALAGLALFIWSRASNGIHTLSKRASFTAEVSGGLVTVFPLMAGLQIDAMDMALYWSIGHLVHALVHAAFGFHRHGILPPVTALLHTGIRLIR